MKLNINQRYALLGCLVNRLPAIIHNPSVICEFDRFCDGDYKEWRVIYCYGMAGKIWNNNDEICITGHSSCEVRSKADFEKELQEVDKWNQEIKELLERYK